MFCIKIQEEYERLQRLKEEERLQRKTNPKVMKDIGYVQDKDYDSKY